jgi:hypothetical protein
MPIARRILGSVVLVTGMALAASAAAAPLAFGPHDVRSAFYVSKSENDNQVHYAVRADASCHPVGARPVFAYWRRLKQGARVDAALEGLGTRFYGASDTQTVSHTEGGGRVRMFVKALKQVPVDITLTRRADGKCEARATTTIAHAPARLDHAHLQLGRFGLTVRYVDVVGFRQSDGARVSERLK